MRHARRAGVTACGFAKCFVVRLSHTAELPETLPILAESSQQRGCPAVDYVSLEADRQ